MFPMKIRNSTSFTCITIVSLLILIIISRHESSSRRNSTGVLESNRKLVRELKLTDLCLFTEARYTRHPSMADYHAAFQEHPVALDHFPSGSLLLPTRPTVRTNAEKR